MCKIIFLYLLCTGYAFSQTGGEESYAFGHNGMELIVSKENETVIINNFNAKMTIREDIAQQVLHLYNERSLASNTDITVIGNEAKVKGKIIIEKKNKLTSVSFYYEKVMWNSGLTEVYKPN